MTHQTKAPWYAALLMGVVLIWSAASLQAELATITAEGTVTEFTPGSALMLRAEGVAAPTSYVIGKTTTIVDASGAPLEWSACRAGVPVRVVYAREGDRMIVSRVTILR